MLHFGVTDLHVHVTASSRLHPALRMRFKRSPKCQFIRGSVLLGCSTVTKQVLICDPICAHCSDDLPASNTHLSLTSSMSMSNFCRPITSAQDVVLWAITFK